MIKEFKPKILGVNLGEQSFPRIHQLINEFNYTLITASSPSEASDILATAGNEIALVMIAEPAQPGIGGVFFGELSAIYPDVPKYANCLTRRSRPEPIKYKRKSF